MHDNRDPTSKKCKHGIEDVVSVVLAIGISVLSIGLLFSIFKPGDSGGGFIKAEGSIGGSVTVGGLLDKEDDTTDNNGADTDTDTGKGTDTEKDNTADTDTTPGAGTENDPEIPSEGETVSKITFTIDDIECTAEEGMNWEHWLNSEYFNPDIGLLVLYDDIEECDVIKHEEGLPLYYPNIIVVKSTDIIQSGTSYILHF